MDYTVWHVTTEDELDAALALEKRVFGFASELRNSDYSREKWLERMTSHGDLMIFAKSNNEIIGIVFGRVESNGSITIGPVVVDERFRKHGIAEKLMLSLEVQALSHGIHHLALGSMESAEGFYEKLGYKGILLIQSQEHSIDEMLALNSKYKVIRINVYDGTVNQIYLELPVPDRDFQRNYENAFSNCHTQMVFSKTI